MQLKNQAGIKLIPVLMRRDHPRNGDQRRWARRNSDVPIRIFSEGSQLPIEGHCTKLSAGGMCFFAVGNFTPGAKISFEFLHPGSKSSERVRGTIRNRTVYLYGVEYEAPSRARDC